MLSLFCKVSFSLLVSCSVFVTYYSLWRVWMGPFSSPSEYSVLPIRVMCVLFSVNHNPSFICAGPVSGRVVCMLSARRIRKRHKCAHSSPLSSTTNSTMLQLGTWRVQCTFLKIDYIFFFISNCALVLLSAVYLQLVMNKSHVTLSYLFYAFLFVLSFL